MNKLFNLIPMMLDDFFEDAFDYIGIIIGIVMAIVVLAIVITVIVVIVKHSRNISTQAVEYYKKVKDKITENIEEDKNKHKCPYCDTQLKETEDRCPNCGARKK